MFLLDVRQSSLCFDQIASAYLYAVFVVVEIYGLMSMRQSQDDELSAKEQKTMGLQISVKYNE